MLPVPKLTAVTICALLLCSCVSIHWRFFTALWVRLHLRVFASHLNRNPYKHLR